MNQTKYYDFSQIKQLEIFNFVNWRRQSKMKKTRQMTLRRRKKFLEKKNIILCKDGEVEHIVFKISLAELNPP